MKQDEGEDPLALKFSELEMREEQDLKSTGVDTTKAFEEIKQEP